MSVTKANYMPPLTTPLTFERVEHGVLVPVEAISKNLIDDERVLCALEAAQTPLTRAEWESACNELEPKIGVNRAGSARTRLIERGLVEAREVAKGNGQKRGAKRLAFFPSWTAAQRDRTRFDGGTLQFDTAPAREVPIAT